MPDSSFFLGRIHIDPSNSFFYREIGLDGMIELSRISSLPLQQLSRTTIGTPITSLEMKIAFEQGYLIPYRKNNPEDPKTAVDLLKIDRGGLTFRPEAGIYENVAELDFFSMYPSIIANYNLSYETINCKHKKCIHRLPTAGYRICTQKEGILPKTLKFLIERRKQYKKLKKKEGDKYDRRQIGIKWLLVVSFGYLGYKNAVFGRIESHETTTAIGRDLLLFVKDIAEKEGFSLLHGLTDCIWIYKKGATEEAYNKLKDNINKKLSRKYKGVLEETVPFEVKLEGVYDWIVFVPSKEDGVGVPNRFYGKFKDGRIKVRGIELRRSDTPRFIKEFQEDFLNHLSKAKNKKELLKKLSDIDTFFEKYAVMLREGKFCVQDLIVRKRLSKLVEEYRVKNDISETAGTLIKEGITVNPGEKVNIIYIKDSFIKAVPYEIYIKSPKPVDIKRYEKLLKESCFVFEFIKDRFYYD